MGVTVIVPQQYGEHVSRITTPFDHFMADFRAWLDTAWYIWVAMAAIIAIIVAVVVISKLRARALARVPQYRRQLNPD